MNDVPTLAKRLEQIPSASIFDVLDDHGLGESCCLDHAIRPIRGGSSIAGPAYTVKWVPDPRGRDWQPYGLKRISDYFTPITDGDIVVVDGGRDRACGHWGQMLSTMAKIQGARGVVVDGGTRDTNGILAIDGWEAFARYSSPIESVGRNRIHAIQVPLILDGALGAVTVAPGDWIKADCDAVLVIPADIVEEIVNEAEPLEERDRSSVAALEAGEDMNAVFKRYGRG